MAPQRGLLRSISGLIVGWLLLVACVSADDVDDQLAGEPEATSVSLPVEEEVVGSSAGDDEDSGLPPATPTTTAAANQPENIDPAEFLDAELRSPVGIAANHGWLFLAAQRRDVAASDQRECPATSQITVVGAVGVRQTLVVPGDVVHRVEIGAGDWGFAAVSCASTSWVIPLRVVDRSIEVVAGTPTGEPQIYEAALPSFHFYFAPVGSVWRSTTSITVWDHDGAEAGLLDLASGERASSSSASAGLETQLPNDIATVFLAGVAPPERVYYVSPDQSCHGGPRDAVSTPRVISANGDNAVAADPRVAFRGLAQMVFGPQNQVAWLNTCNWAASIWTATVDVSTGEFDSITEVIGEQWLADSGWNPGAFAFGLRAISFDERGSMVAWAHTDQGLETARAYRNDAGVHLFNPPQVVVAADPGPPVLVAAPADLDSAERSDVEIHQLASGRAAGTADRAGLVFYGLDTNEAETGIEGCDGATSPVFGFGASPVPERVAVVPGTRLTTFQVDWQGHLVAVSTCDETTYVSVGEFDVATRTVGAGSLRVWKIDQSQTQPYVQVTGDIRWGPHLFDQESGTWQVVRRTGEPLIEKGHSDSGRYRYFAEPGFLGDETGPIDPTLRLMVEDTTTGVIRPAADSPVGVAAPRLIFGPNDEVAWIVGNELGAWAVLGRMDWSTGEIVEAERLMPDLEPYWGHPLSGSGRPGPDAIAFEPDGTLRAWAYTFGPTDSRSSENWIVDTLTFSLDD